MKQRLARVQISTKFLEMILRCDVSFQGKKFTTTAPKDMKIVRIYQGPKLHGHSCFAIVESEEFEIVEEGQEIPLIPAFSYSVESEAE